MARTRTRIGDGTGRLLLLAALLLGIVTMHTLGHPSGGHGGTQDQHGTTTQQAGATAPRPDAAQDQRGATAHQAGVAVQRSGGVVHQRAVGYRSVAGVSHGSGDGMGMDPLSVCLAVLGAFTLLVLVRAGLLRPGGAIDRSRTPGRLPYALRPNPPPPRTLLSHLSVLRI
ncbi:hypothetical protein [Streptomyces venezuelae]|uniref:hypothetical protein n=1 Tax=Streptomyces venezuelae TaxID=54571 RepID=UPI0037B3644C